MWAGQRTGSYVLLPGPTQRVALLLQRLWWSSGSAPCPQLTRCPVEAKAGAGDNRGGVGRAPDSVQIALTSWFLKANALPFPSISAAFTAFEGTFPTLRRALALLNDWFCQHPAIPSEDYLPALLTWMSSIYSLPKWLRSILGNPTPCSPSSRILP